MKKTTMFILIMLFSIKLYASEYSNFEELIKSDKTFSREELVAGVEYFKKSLKKNKILKIVVNPPFNVKVHVIKEDTKLTEKNPGEVYHFVKLKAGWSILMFHPGPL